MKLLLWMAVPLMLVGAIMLIADAGAAALWTGLIVVGIAMVVVELSRSHKTVHR